MRGSLSTHGAAGRWRQTAPPSPRSRYTVVPGCVCRIDAGAIGDTGALEAGLDGRRLARVRDDADDRARLQNLADRHRDRLRRHVVDRGEPAFADLLPPAGLVERDDEVRLLGLEIGRRIVEGEMAVLADPDKARRRSAPDAIARPASSATCASVALAVEQMVRSRCPSARISRSRR